MGSLSMAGNCVSLAGCFEVFTYF